jgi:hypothetical protein
MAQNASNVANQARRFIPRAGGLGRGIRQPQGFRVPQQAGRYSVPTQQYVDYSKAYNPQAANPSAARGIYGAITNSAGRLGSSIAQGTRDTYNVVRNMGNQAVNDFRFMGNQAKYRAYQGANYLAQNPEVNNYVANTALALGQTGSLAGTLMSNPAAHMAMGARVLGNVQSKFGPTAAIRARGAAKANIGKFVHDVNEQATIGMPLGIFN